MKKNNFVNDYDKINYKKNYQKDINLIIKKSKNVRIKKVLDIGCGTGNYTILLNKKLSCSRKNILGIDIDKDSIKIAKKKGNFFKHLEISKLKLNNFTIVTILFNVINSIKSLRDLKKFFKHTKKRMGENSIIFFDCIKAIKEGTFRKKKKFRNFKLIVETSGYVKKKSKKLKINYKITRLGKKKFTYEKKIINYYWSKKKIISILKELNFKSIETIEENHRLVFSAKI